MVTGVSRSLTLRIPARAAMGCEAINAGTHRTISRSRLRCDSAIASSAGSPHSRCKQQSTFLDARPPGIAKPADFIA